MATLSVAPIKVSRLEGLQSMPIRHGQEDGSETWKAGALLVFNGSTGQIAECGADPAVVIGVALANATGTQGRDVAYVANIPGVIFEASLDESGAQGVYAAVQTDVGVQYGAAKQSSPAYWYVDQDETSTKVFEIVSILSDIGDITPRVEVKFTLVSME